MMLETTASGQPSHEQVDDEVNSSDTQSTPELVAMDVREQSHPWWSAESLLDPGGTVAAGTITVMDWVSYDRWSHSGTAFYSHYIGCRCCR